LPWNKQDIHGHETREFLKAATDFIASSTAGQLAKTRSYGGVIE
jgi:hypothetical protein